MDKTPEQIEQDKINAYADFHIKRGTGTWRDWEHSDKYDLPGHSSKPNKGDNDGTKSSGRRR